MTRLPSHEDNVPTAFLAKRRRRHCVCCSPSVSVVKLVCVVMMLGSATTFLFGRGVISITQGSLGMLASAEGYFGVRKMNRQTVGWYAAYLMVNAIASVAIGMYVLTYRHTSCQSAANVDTCISTLRLYGMLTMTVSSVAGFCLSVCVWLAYRAMPHRRDRVAGLAMATVARGAASSIAMRRPVASGYSAVQYIPKA